MFPYPQRSSSRIYVIFDVCHMIKLMRNLLHHYKTICHEENGILRSIKWQYIHSLNNVQDEVGFCFANKLKIGAQTLSTSVASAIDFLWDDLSLPQFQNSETTTEFIKKLMFYWTWWRVRTHLQKVHSTQLHMNTFQNGLPDVKISLNTYLIWKMNRVIISTMEGKNYNLGLYIQHHVS